MGIWKNLSEASMAGGGRRWPSAAGIITAGVMVLPLDREDASRELIRRVDASVGIRRAGLDEAESGGGQALA